MNDFFPSDVKEASDKLTSEWLRGADFEAGLTLQLVKPLEKVKSNFGAEAGDYLVDNNILAEGESFRYTFTDAQGVEKKIDSASTPFFIAFKQCEELGVGDWVLITRTGQTTKTRYTVEKVDAPTHETQETTTPQNIPS